MARILVVDDHPKNIQVIGNILSLDKYEIEFARDGIEALGKIKRGDFDLILLDVMMPILDGFEVCKKIKQLEGKASIPVIFVTAKTDHESIKKGFEVGAVDYITKPFIAEELLQRVKTHVELAYYRKFYLKNL